MFNSHLNQKEIKNIANKKFAIVVAEFNAEYTERMLEDALDAFRKENVEVVRVLRVPGAFELPFGAQLLIEEDKVDAVLTLGVVIRGETSHYDHVCDTAANGVMQVGLQHKKPVLFGVLTCENREQVERRMVRVKELAVGTMQMVGVLK